MSKNYIILDMLIFLLNLFFLNKVFFVKEIEALFFVLGGNVLGIFHFC